MTTSRPPRAIEIRGLRHNTLQGLDVDVPLGRVVMLSGVSGSGKSSLAMGTLYAEGLQRFLQTLSAYSRRRLAQAPRPDAERIDHLPPAVALRQRLPPPGPRSTVGTLSEALNALRLMVSRLGTHRCPNGHAVAAAAATQGLEIACPECGARFEHPSAESFSFNGSGACPGCDGLGRRFEADPLRLVPDPSQTLNEGAVLPWTAGTRRLSRDAAGQLGVRLDVPYERLSAREREIVLHGPARKVPVLVRTRAGRAFTLDVTYENAIATAERAARGDDDRSRAAAARFLTGRTCSTCDGSRLSATALTSTLGGHDLAALCALDLRALGAFAREVAERTPAELRGVASRLVGDLAATAATLAGLGLGYLTLDRDGDSLSTGERRRLQLAATTRSGTTGILYVLDEPSAGLHPMHVDALGRTLAELAAAGNSVVVVEHDPQLLRSADWIIELGPGAGSAGGEVVAQGPPSRVAAARRSLIGPYLAGRVAPARTPRARPRPGGAAVVRLAVSELYNLRDAELTLPVGAFTAVAGPSGAGKSALLLDGLVLAATAALGGRPLPAQVARLELGGIEHVVAVDAAPIGTTPRSTPATYCGAWDVIRGLFAGTAEARRRGWTARRFSYNMPDGRCPTCRGLGALEVDVQYLPDIPIPCPACRGARYAPETLEVELDDGLSVAGVLALPVAEALARFAANAPVARRLAPIADVGLGHLRLGEPTPALSGGEAQRLRLAAHLATRRRRVLYVLDEPSTGLHPLDVQRLLAVIDRLLDDGATVVAIDHDVELLAAADHVVDMGPGGGPDGGRIVASGTPAELAADPASVTGPWIAARLSG